MRNNLVHDIPLIIPSKSSKNENHTRNTKTLYT